MSATISAHSATVNQTRLGLEVFHKLSFMLMRPRGLWPSAEHGKSLNKVAGKDPIQSINP